MGGSERDMAVAVVRTTDVRVGMSTPREVAVAIAAESSVVGVAS